MPAVSPEILKQVKGIELRTRGLVGSLFAGEYRSVFRGQGMEFAEVRAYEPGDDFRSHRLERLGPAGEPLRQDVHRGARADAHAARRPVGLDPVRRAGHQGIARDRGGRGARARGRAPERPGRRTPLRRRGRARDSAAEGSAPRAPRSFATSSPSSRWAGTPTWPRASPTPSRLLRHRSIVVVLSDFIADGLGTAAPPAVGAARGRRDHGGRSARARPARVRLDRDAGRRVGPARAGRHGEPGRPHAA